jgi:hypothetical protein
MPIMNKRILFIICIIVSFDLRAQPPADKAFTEAHLSITHDMIRSGEIFVKERNTAADRISFSDKFRKSSWSSIAAKLAYTFENSSSLRFSLENFFFSGKNYPAHNIHYNTLVIDGAGGISIDKSRIFRFLIAFQKPFSRDESKTRTYYTAGLIHDAINFKINGSIINDGEAGRLSEDFNDQLIPCPFVGAGMEYHLNKSGKSLLTLDASGTYVPGEIKLFKGRNRDYYYFLNSSIGYKYYSGRFSLNPNITYKLIGTSEDNKAHQFLISGTGLSLDAGWIF